MFGGERDRLGCGSCRDALKTTGTYAYCPHAECPYEDFFERHKIENYNAWSDAQVAVVNRFLESVILLENGRNGKKLQEEL